VSATTLFTAYKSIQPDTQTVEVHGELNIGDEYIDIASDVTLEFDEQEDEVEFDEEDIEELTPREARMLLSALWKHHVKPAVDALTESRQLNAERVCPTESAEGSGERWAADRKEYFRQAVSQMQGVIADAMEGAA